MNYGLPTALDVGGVRHKIRSDYRAVLDIISALSDCELNNAEKINVLLNIFYVDNIPDDIEDAINKCFWFINCGQPERKTRGKKLMDWEQDFPIMIGSINRVAGTEVRALEYLHWWTFMGYYMDLGDCYFAQVVAIRKKKSEGKKLDKIEQDFYKNNREVINLKVATTTEEDELINKWTGGE